MMEQQFFEDEFEQFLKENADQHRMYPSSGVWTNIYRRMHPGRRRVAIGALLLLLLSTMVWLATSEAVRNPSKLSSGPSAAISSNAPEQVVSNVTVHDIIAKLRAKSLIPPMAIEAPMRLRPLQIASTRENNQLTAFDPSTIRVGPLALAPTLAAANLELYLYSQPASLATETGPALIALHTQEYTRETGLATPAAAPLSPETRIARFSLPALYEYNEKPLTELIPLPESTAKGFLYKSPDTDAISRELLRLQQAKPGKFAFMLHFAPTVGYRSLVEGKSRPTYGNSPLMVSHLNVNRFVDHKPAIGFELGGDIRYSVSKAFSFRGGLQLNLTRYSIDAFSHIPEKATVALRSDYGMTNTTLVATSSVRNLGGDNPRSLTNQYLQVTLPLAAELKLLGDQVLQVNIAGGIQPSYLLNTNQYLLSNNFSNYVREPSLVRRWNLASSMEAFVSYQSGDMRWQIGPQFRYNLLSTYKKQYPIRENLMEYAIKIGVTKTLR